MLAAIDSAGAHIGAAMRPAMRRAPDWPAAVRAAIGGVFNFLASRPALARLVLVDAYVAGPAALKRRVGTPCRWRLASPKVESRQGRRPRSPRS